MKKITLLITIFISLIFFIAGCGNVSEEGFVEDKPSLGGIVIGYNHEDKKEI